MVQLTVGNFTGVSEGRGSFPMTVDVVVGVVRVMVIEKVVVVVVVVVLGVSLGGSSIETVVVVIVAAAVVMDRSLLGRRVGVERLLITGVERTAIISRIILSQIPMRYKMNWTLDWVD